MNSVETLEPDVGFAFDPTCPWTWRTSRWLVEVAEAEGLTVEWQAMSLLVVKDDDVDDAHRPPLEAGMAALRVVEALRASANHREAGAFYAALGRAWHDGEAEQDLATVRRIAAESGVDDGPVDDRSWDDAVHGATKAAVDDAGPHVGSPVLRLAGVPRGMFGPILADVPTGPAALELWQAVRTLHRSEVFHELKRGRR